jgi:protein-S-isoprenylcysteine O-methyltransferase Ste14
MTRKSLSNRKTGLDLKKEIAQDYPHRKSENNMTGLQLKIPPVIQAALCIMAMWTLDKYLPILSLQFPFLWLITAIFMIAGGVIGIAGIFSFVKEKTTVDPRTPEMSGKLVIKGVYRFSRNPMYLGLLLILLGISLMFGSLSSFLPIPIFVWTMNRLQIEPEETALTELFGQSYQDYMYKVRRWL